MKNKKLELFLDPKRELSENLTAYLLRNPEDAPFFLNIISNALTTYKQAVKEERNGQSLESIHDLLYYSRSSKLFKSNKQSNLNGKITTLISACFLMYPKANKGNGSQCMEDALAELIKLCREVNILKNPEWKSWLEEREEKHEWLKKVLTAKK